MAIDTFIPTIWHARLLAQLEKSLVYAQAGISNREYEGEIRAQGDTVRIGAIGPVTITPYVKNTPLAAAETLNDASQTLVIDQGRYFNFAVDDVDKAQGNPAVMERAMRSAAYGLADVADQYVAGLSWQSVPAAATQGAVGGAITVGYGNLETNPYIALLNMKTDLDEANVPSEGRFAIIPPWFEAYLLMDNRIVGSGAPAADTRAINGFIGMVAGFNLYRSNNVPFAAGPIEFKIVAGVSDAISYAEQITKVEAYRPELRFADAVKGLHIYGAKVVRPECLALLIATAGTPA